MESELMMLNPQKKNFKKSLKKEEVSWGLMTANTSKNCGTLGSKKTHKIIKTSLIQ